jgi:syntaxin 16
MATRSLTDVFILMRNNAMQNRYIFSEQAPPNLVSMSPQVADDRMALVASSSVNTLAEEIVGNTAKTSRLPPEWVDGVEEIQYEISRIKQRIRELSSVYDRHLNRPTMDDDDEEDHQIRDSTQQLSQMFSNCQRLVQQINAKSSLGTVQERKLTQNILSSLAAQLQDQTSVFRKKQIDYSNRCARRDAHSGQLFDMTLILEPETDSSYFDEESHNQGLTSQLLMVEENNVMVRQREKEINKMVQSITDLNLIFKELAGMVAEQGSVLDR